MLLITVIDIYFLYMLQISSKFTVRFLRSTFLRASAMLKHVIAIGWTSVRPSVPLSVTRWYCVETAQPIVIQTVFIAW